MEFASLKDVKGKQIFKRAKDFYFQHEYIKALEVIRDLSFVNDYRDKRMVNFLQGTIFKDLSRKTDNTDVKYTYLLGSVEIFSMHLSLSLLAAISFFDLAQHLESVLYYKKALVTAKQSFSLSLSAIQDLELVKHIIKISESKIAESKTAVASTVKKSEQKVRESKDNEETRKIDFDLVKRLKSCWDGLNVEVRKNFMKVDAAEFRSFVERLYGREGRHALEQVLTWAKEDRTWMFWMCRTCSKKFPTANECKNHFEQEHGAKFKLDSTNDEVQMISKALARKISVGGWEPVDAVAAVEMIKNQLEDVKAFAYETGWSKDWPLATDEERSKLLHEIQQLLVSFYDLKIFSCSIQDWLMDVVVKHLEKLEVPKHILTECLLLETPQSICFLENVELNQIMDFLKSINCERNDGTDLVCRAVDSFCGGTRVKEKIDFDPRFSFLLLDKRLLQGKIAQFDDEGTVNVFNPNAHYAKAHVHGDDILSWLADNSSGDETFRFPRIISAHNLDIWVAVLRAIQFTCRTLGAKYQKKLKLLCFSAALDDVKNLCMLEDERRRNILEDQWTSYATLICDKYEKLSARDYSLATRIHLSVVRQVLEAVLDPTFDIPDSEDSLNVIREHKYVTDYSVLTSIDYLKLIVTYKIFYKVPRMDSKILLIEKSRINLLNCLTRLSVFDYRSYILGPLKEFLLQGILDMESKAKTAAANAALLLEEEEEKKPQTKKKKNKRTKKTSTSVSSPLDKTVEHVPKHTVSSERDQLETSSNTDNQEEAARRASQLTNMPGENSLSKNLESAHGAAATRCKSALEMTLKALCNIKALKEYLVQNRDQFPENLEEQVPSALQSFFTAFVSEIKEEGVHSYLLESLLASLESRDAAELLVSILEFWPCWKNPEIESVVTRLFTLDEYERMSCSECEKKPNYQEQSSYGIVIAANSIRDLKCAFGDIKFMDILKVILMEDKMLCDTKTGGCGKTNFVHRIISRCPHIFTIVLEWVKNETEEEISETTKALDWEIDISKIYEGLEPNKKYRLVSMVGYGKEEEEYICLAYKTTRWFSLKHEALPEEDVGDWKSVVRFCVERKVRPEVLFYETA